MLQFANVGLSPGRIHQVSTDVGVTGSSPLEATASAATDATEMFTPSDARTLPTDWMLVAFVSNGDDCFVLFSLNFAAARTAHDFICSAVQDVVEVLRTELVRKDPNNWQKRFRVFSVLPESTPTTQIISTLRKYRPHMLRIAQPDRFWEKHGRDIFLENVFEDDPRNLELIPATPIKDLATVAMWEQVEKLVTADSDTWKFQVLFHSVFHGFNQYSYCVSPQYCGRLLKV